MGTSKSSAGSPSKVPMVPPWVPEIENQDKPEVPDVVEPPKSEKPAVAQAPVEQIAPAGRFNSTRRALGSFAKSGGENRLKRGVGRYIKTGLGGVRTATARFNGTAVNAGSLYAALGGNGSGDATRTALDDALRDGRSAKQIVDAVIEIVCPVNGNQDGEAARNAMNDAFAELLRKFPESDLLNLSENERTFVVENYVGIDVYRRFALDVGNKFRENASSPTVALTRLKQAKEYIKETVRASFKKLREKGGTLSGKSVQKIVRSALQDAFEVFAEYAE